MDAKFYSGIFEGDNLNGVRLGMGVTGGEFWARRRGCMAIYRGDVHQIDYENILCTAARDSTQVTLPNWIEHTASGCAYGVREIDGQGQEIQSTGNTVYINFDAHGRAAEVGIQGILKIQGRAIQGRANLEWWYEPAAGQPAITQFLIFRDHGSGCIDHTAAAGAVTYIGKRPYMWMSDTLAVGNYWFEITAERADKMAAGSAMACVTICEEQEPGTLDIFEISHI